MVVPNSHKAHADPSQRTTFNKKKPAKFGGAFKKVGQYFQQQAQSQSHSALYLSPRDPTVQKHVDITEQEVLQHLTAADLNGLPFGVIPPLSSNNDTPRSSTMTSTTTDSVSADTGIFQSMSRHQYASDNILQSYDVLLPSRQPSTPNDDAYFIIFIHGGYFRDPKQTSRSFNPTISLLESSDPNTLNRITGYASINYRLAPHPGHPQDPKTTPPYTLNNAYWPDQPNDILAALRHIQSHYPQSKRYILAGHSVGATLSLIATLRASDADIVPPVHVIGICGIYDFPLIHKTNPEYESMTKGSMSPSKYSEASPALYDVETYSRKWKTNGQKTSQGKTRVLLAHGRADELVNWAQVESMCKVFCGDGGEGEDEKKNDFRCEIVEIEGRHYECLDNGEVARCFREVLGGTS